MQQCIKLLHSSYKYIKIMPWTYVGGHVQQHAVQQVLLLDLARQRQIHAQLQTSFPVQYNLHKQYIDSEKYLTHMQRCTEWCNKSSAVAEMGNHLATIDISQKVGAAVPLSMGGAGSPSNTMSPGPPTSVHLDPSNLLVTIYQRYRQTGQTDRQDNSPVA